MVELRLRVRSDVPGPESERERARVMEDGERRDWGANVGWILASPAKECAEEEEEETEEEEEEESYSDRGGGVPPAEAEEDADEFGDASMRGVGRERVEAMVRTKSVSDPESEALPTGTWP